MDLKRAYYMLAWENAFLKAKGEQFQRFFDRLMGLAHKGDYMPTRPWGREGDRKNDGFLKSERMLFQLYGPDEMSGNKARAKISEDFNGALAHWGGHFDRWVFVHNARDGLPPHVIELILEFERAHNGVTLELWGFEELRDVFWRLTIQDCESWFGPAPSEATLPRLQLADIEQVLRRIESLPAVVGDEVSEVSMGKIESNALSESAAHLLKTGMTKASLVERFFEQWHDVALGSRLAEAFRDKYRSLRDEGQPPDAIFAELQAWITEPEKLSPSHQVAVLAVLAYFFERCDIFEPAREGAI